VSTNKHEANAASIHLNKKVSNQIKRLSMCKQKSPAEAGLLNYNKDENND